MLTCFVLSLMLRTLALNFAQVRSQRLSQTLYLLQLQSNGSNVSCWFGGVKPIIREVASLCLVPGRGQARSSKELGSLRNDFYILAYLGLVSLARAEWSPSLQCAMVKIIWQGGHELKRSRELKVNSTNYGSMLRICSRAVIALDMYKGKNFKHF